MDDFLAGFVVSAWCLLFEAKRGSVTERLSAQILEVNQLGFQILVVSGINFVTLGNLLNSLCFGIFTFEML